MYNKIKNLIKESETISIFMHINPDGDCISSSIALFLYLKKLGKTAHIFTENKEQGIPTKLQFLPSSEIINTEQLSEYDLAIALDCGDAARLGANCFRLFLKSKNRAVIDHHESSAKFCENTILEPKAASTTQILYKFFEKFDSSIIDSDIATALYTGLVTDSGGFTFSNTSPETHNVAAKLLEYGAVGYDICRRVLKNVPIGVFLLTNRVLSRASFHFDNTLAIISFEQNDYDETGTDPTHTEGIINNLINIEGVELAFSIAPSTDMGYKVGIRSKEKVNAGAVAKCFGGGGHFSAAGCRIYGYYEDVINKILDVSKEMMSDD